MWISKTLITTLLLLMPSSQTEPKNTCYSHYRRNDDRQLGTRYKGNSTFCLPNDEGNVKVPYNMDFQYWNPDGDLLGYHKVKLANAWLDPLLLKNI